MSTILYYSRFCESSNKILAALSKYSIIDSIHFICIDKRVNKGGKIYVILENGQEMLLPEAINQVPALMILSQQYRIIYGGDILKYFQSFMQAQVNHATKNNTVPVQTQANDSGLSGFGGFGGFSGFGSGIVSDSYSFLDQNVDELDPKGNGGLRQMHNYATLNGENTEFNRPSTSAAATTGTSSGGSNKIKEGEISLEQLKMMRDQEASLYAPKRFA